MTDLEEEKGKPESKDIEQDNKDSFSEILHHILLGTKFQLQVETRFGQESIKFQSELVGIEYDNYLIVKFSKFCPLKNFQDILYQGVSLTIRCLCEGTAFGFKTSLLKVIYNPTLIFIKYPESIEYQSIRSDRRVKCLLPAKISVDGNDYEGFAVNISKSGCRFAATSKVSSLSHEINKEIHTLVQLPGVEGYLTMSGKLKQIKRNSDRIDYGIEFNAIEDGTKSKLFKYLSDVEVVLQYLSLMPL